MATTPAAAGDLPGTDALVDVEHVPLTDLVSAHGDSPFLRSIARLRRSLNDPNGVLSAFSSFIDTMP
jgi:hypothetical protein